MMMVMATTMVTVLLQQVDGNRHSNGNHGDGSGNGNWGGDGIRRANHDDIYGASNIVLPCLGS
jgi:hypothetical protein